VSEAIGEDFDGDVAIQLGIGGAVDGAHAAFAEFGGDAVMGDQLLRACRAIPSILSRPGWISRHPEVKLFRAHMTRNARR